MNEHIGFLTCPHCSMPWNDDGQWMCRYCGNTDRPAALRPAGPTWAWLLAGAFLLLGAAVDIALGGTVLRFLGKTFAAE